MSADRSVLLLSHQAEPFCTSRVAGALAERGAQVLRFDTDTFPQTLALSATLEPTALPRLLYRGEPLRVDAVWLWRLWPATFSPSLPREQAQTAVRESLTTLSGFFRSAGRGLLDRPARRHGRGRKQDASASPGAVGRADDSADADHRRPAGGTGVLHRSRRTRHRCCSARWGTRCRAAADCRPDCCDPAICRRYPVCRFVPWYFRNILRNSTNCGSPGSMAGVCRALDGARCGVDWRYESTASWQPHELPAAVHEKLAALMGACRCVRGSRFDRYARGRVRLLEVNPHGEWGMLERDLGLPIGAALADALLRHSHTGHGEHDEYAEPKATTGCGNHPLERHQRHPARATGRAEARGAHMLRFNSDEFPVRGEVLFSQDDAGGRLTFRQGGSEVTLGPDDAVWYRRARWGGQLPQDMDKQLRHGCVEETEALLRGVLAAAPLPHRRFAGAGAQKRPQALPAAPGAVAGLATRAH